jgi:hypothetical protein
MKKLKKKKRKSYEFGGIDPTGFDLASLFASTQVPNAAMGIGQGISSISSMLPGPIGMGGQLLGNVVGMFGARKRKREMEEKMREAKADAAIAKVKQTSKANLANYDQKGTGTYSYKEGGSMYPLYDMFSNPKFGQKFQPFLKMADGGSLSQISDDAIKVNGNNPSKVDDVILGNIAVDHDEVMKKFKDGTLIYSDELFPQGSKKSYADLAAEIEKSKKHLFTSEASAMGLKPKFKKGTTNIPDPKWAEYNDSLDQDALKLFFQQEMSKAPKKTMSFNEGGVVPYGSKEEGELLEKTKQYQTDNATLNELMRVGAMVNPKTYDPKTQQEIFKRMMITDPVSGDQQLYGSLLDRYTKSLDKPTLDTYMKQNPGLNRRAAKEKLFTDMQEQVQGRFNKAIDFATENPSLNAFQQEQFTTPELTEYMTSFKKGGYADGGLKGFGLPDSPIGKTLPKMKLASFDMPGPNAPDKKKFKMPAGLEDTFLNYGSTLYNYIQKPPAIPAPSYVPSIDLKEVNVSDQVGDIKSATQAAIQGVSRTSPTVSQATSNIQNLHAQMLGELNRVRGEEDRINTEIGNREALLNSQISGQNVGIKNQFLQDTLSREIADQRNKAGQLDAMRNIGLVDKRQRNQMEMDKLALAILGKKYDDTGVFGRLMEDLRKEKLIQ